MQLKYVSYFKLPAAGGPSDRGQKDSYGTDLLTLTAVAMTTSCGGRFKLKIHGKIKWFRWTSRFIPMKTDDLAKCADLVRTSRLSLFLSAAMTRPNPRSTYTHRMTEREINNFFTSH